MGLFLASRLSSEQLWTLRSLRWDRQSHGPCCSGGFLHVCCSMGCTDGDDCIVLRRTQGRRQEARRGLIETCRVQVPRALQSSRQARITCGVAFLAPSRCGLGEGSHRLDHVGRPPGGQAPRRTLHHPGLQCAVSAVEDCVCFPRATDAPARCSRKHGGVSTTMRKSNTANLPYALQST